MKAQSVTVSYDGELTIAVGKSRFEKEWKNRQMYWSQLVEKLSITTNTRETIAEFDAMPKNQQDDIKDVGGFVGGTCKGGKRTDVSWRSLLTLDADYATPEFWEQFITIRDYAAMVYSTHKHRPAKPRLRLVIPLKRPVSPDEYQAVSRKVAAGIGMDLFDDTTYQPHRLMYWPSTPADVEFCSRIQDGPWLDPDAVLAEYQDWMDQTTWPESGRTKQARQKMADKQGDPLEKPGMVGIFCRTYSIDEAIADFLSDVYVAGSIPDRYTYVSGSSGNGAVVYGGKFLYSHHGTDPVSSRLVNAFDLVRIHKFADLDAEKPENTPVNRLPSYEAMSEFAAGLDAIKETIGRERLAGAREEFAVDVNWLKKMDADKKGNYLPTPKNVMLILENDPNLAGKLTEDTFAHRILIDGDLPWRLPNDRAAWGDKDESGLRNYLSMVYNITGRGIVLDALNGFLLKHGRHPIREYLNGLVWDGIDRLEDLYIRYFGADDSAYVRAVTRKAFVAAVARVMTPGVKFDNMLVLVGRQGIGKSRLLTKMGKRWFTDSLTTVQGKEAYEAIQGVWIVEMGELSAMKKSEVEHVKHFLSKQTDRFRVPYDRNTSEFPRQCVFFGSTNRDDFLRDATGNRRFWPVQTEVSGPVRSEELARMGEFEVDQLWAEAVELRKAGETLYLDEALDEIAAAEQEAHMEASDKMGPIEEFLELKLPADWYSWDISKRRQYLSGDFGMAPEGVLVRDKVCILEIWCELFGGSHANLNPMIRNEIKDVLLRLPGWTRYTKGTGKLRFGHMYGPQRCFVRRV